MISQPFPMIEPEVVVTPRPDSPLREVHLRDAGGFFVPLEVGAEVKWSFYDWPERVLTNVSHTRVIGTIKYRGEECLDVVDRLIFPEEEQWVGRWLYVKSEDGLRSVLFEFRESETRAKIEEADASPFPLWLRMGDSWEGHEVFRCGSEVRGAGQRHHGVVDGCFEVALPAARWLCLRETLWILDVDGRGLTLAELYVAENGRSVYWRRFNGPAYHNYDQLETTPRREHAGITWRLYYDCLPDISLAQ